jgi:zinc and cadmium transporter
MFAYALIGSLSIVMLSLVGALVFRNSELTERTHRIMLPLAVGVFLGVIFFELIPETLHADELGGSIAILAGFLGFYLLSHWLNTYHHHHDDHDACARHGARKLLIGDAVHNTADGIAIATAFMVNPMVGILTTLGIALHEVPQEIAEFTLLKRAGYSTKRALYLNVLSALTVVFGVVLSFLFSNILGAYAFILTGIAAGNLLYIATADLLPELRHSHRDHFALTFGATLVGVLLIGSIITLSHEWFEQEGAHSQTFYEEAIVYGMSADSRNIVSEHHSVT